jgi:hypothetical protein
MIGQIHEVAARLLVEVPDTPEYIGIVLATVNTRQPNPLIGLNAGAQVYRVRAYTGGSQVALGPNHKEGPDSVQSVQATEIQIRTIHDIEGARFERDIVECVYIVLTAFGDG